MGFYIMRWILLVSFATLLLIGSLHAAEVKNLDAKQVGNRVLFEYDVAGDEDETEVTFSLTINGKTYNADTLHLEGDHGKVKVGEGKKVWWNVLQDFPKGYAGDLEYEIAASNSSKVFTDKGKTKDIWTTSVFSYAAGGGGPGGGLDNEWLEVGGWGDLYYSLIQFDLTNLPPVASSARIELFVVQMKGDGTTKMYMDRVAEFWDWRIQGTGSDRKRLWWADRPAAVQWIPGSLPAPTVGQWYSIDITDLYNAWQSGTYPNYGIQLRPVSNNNRWNEFYSSNYTGDPSLRPRLVVKP
ncbi:MAG: DNRLRE domain-containing protein [Nitrospirae bacterium]|nr:DNRLRE domain-containing protein [Nitrospirota bacterium]